MSIKVLSKMKENHLFKSNISYITDKAVGLFPYSKVEVQEENGIISVVESVSIDNVKWVELETLILAKMGAT